ncbi:MAG TPA: hypothetical protein VKS21_13705 [Spirochaetota bacterium]|nr:hypothetical protein [Spirochaetota bacterium]
MEKNIAGLVLLFTVLGFLTADPAKVSNSSPDQSAAAGSNSSISSKVYNIGDKGPAGGWIFFDKGNYSNGWRYLEAAPSVDSVQLPWGGPERVSEAVAMTPGSGKQNTAAMLAKYPDSEYAANFCTQLTQGDYTDWFLPSKEALMLMYKNLYRQGRGDFTNGLYWSSSQDIADRAWMQSFEYGYQYNYTKSHPLLVHPVRAF